MFQESKLDPDELMPLRHFDEAKMSFETFRFRKTGPSVRIPTYASQPHVYGSPSSQSDDNSGDSDDSYPLEGVSSTLMDGVRQRKRSRREAQTWLIASEQSAEVMEKEKMWKTLMMKGVQWVQDPAGELRELTGWTYAPVSYSFVFLVGIGCGIMYNGWLTDLGLEDASYLTKV